MNFLDIENIALGVRLNNIEVMISSKLENQPTMYVKDSKAGSISWKHFVSCGKTNNSSAFEDRTVTCTQVQIIYNTIKVNVFTKV